MDIFQQQCDNLPPIFNCVVLLGPQSALDIIFIIDKCYAILFFLLGALVLELYANDWQLRSLSRVFYIRKRGHLPYSHSRINKLF